MDMNSYLLVLLKWFIKILFSCKIFGHFKKIWFALILGTKSIYIINNKRVFLIIF
jgi:hypothetical protein